MAVTTGKDGKLHYRNENKLIDGYESYGHWYDEGPGSESFKRKIRESAKKSPVPPIDFAGRASATKQVEEWPEWKQKAAAASLGYHKKPKKEYITDEDLEIDV